MCQKKQLQGDSGLSSSFGSRLRGNVRDEDIASQAPNAERDDNDGGNTKGPASLLGGEQDQLVDQSRIQRAQKQVHQKHQLDVHRHLLA